MSESKEPYIPFSQRLKELKDAIADYEANDQQRKKSFLKWLETVNVDDDKISI